ncbi:MAG: ABC transporter ATP-binding protein [Tepidibacillus sp.]
MITFSEVTKIYEDGTEAIKHLNFTIEKGEFFVLIGPSGCGKTTTMKMINRLIEPTSGSIQIHQKEIHEYHLQELRWNIGYVLQQIALFPHMTIAENIALVPEMKKWKKDRIRTRIDELLKMVNLDPEVYRDRKPAELSGGEQQRVGVIRALAGDPDVVLMDEPFSALDPISREQLQQDIRRLQQEIKKTIVFVTHDMDEAIALADRICLMKKGEIVQIDRPKNLITNPKDDFVKEFIGDRQTPWMTKVELVMNRDLFLMKQDVQQNPFPTVTHEESLSDAVEMMREKQVEICLVTKENQVVGFLDYKGIVEYLQQKSRKEEDALK